MIQVPGMGIRLNTNFNTECSDTVLIRLHVYTCIYLKSEIKTTKHCKYTKEIALKPFKCLYKPHVICTQVRTYIVTYT